MAASIATCDYTYGAGGSKNRRIQFSRSQGRPDTVQAGVFTLSGSALGSLIATISGDCINVRMQSLAQKINALSLAREQDVAFKPTPDRKLSDLSLAEQDAVLSSLGNRAIEIRNELSSENGLETPESIIISAISPGIVFSKGVS